MSLGELLRVIVDRLTAPSVPVCPPKGPRMHINENSASTTAAPEASVEADPQAKGSITERQSEEP